jgi:hypothetical protein
MLAEEPAQLGDEPLRSLFGDEVPGRCDGAGDVGGMHAQRGGRVGGPVRSGADHEHRGVERSPRQEPAVLRAVGEQGPVVGEPTTTVWSRASGGSTRRQARPVCGQPCSSTNVGPVPPTATDSRVPLVGTSWMRKPGGSQSNAARPPRRRRVSDYGVS